MKKQRYTLFLIVAILYAIITISLLFTGEPGQFIASLILSAIFFVLYFKIEKKPKHKKTTSKKKSSPASNSFIIENHKVAGTTYHVAEIESLGFKNQFYNLTEAEFLNTVSEDCREYEYCFNPSHVELIEEPNNPHDPNAIKVVIDGKHVGYIKRGSCSHIKNLLRANLITNIDAKIGGGRYKSIYSEYDFDKGESIYNLEKSEINYFIDVTLTLKKMPEKKSKSTNKSSESEPLVWVDKTAACYHKSNGCGMNNAYQVPLRKARSMGKKPCKRCYP